MKSCGKAISSLAWWVKPKAPSPKGWPPSRPTTKLLDVFVDTENLKAAEAAKRTNSAGGKVRLEKEPGDDDDKVKFEDEELKRLFGEAAAVVEGRYGLPAITHMCLEPHGSTCEWNDGKLTAHLSTQSVAMSASGYSELGLSANDVTIHCDYIGGGFGSKFSPDPWGVLAAKLSKDLGRPVKLMLDRDLELKNAGSRPSSYADVKIGADKDGVITVWDSHHWTSGGLGSNARGPGVAQDVMPYVIVPPNYRRKVTNVTTNTSMARAWRAPNHPQGSVMSQTAIDDIAAKLGLDSYDVFQRNLVNVPKERASVYAAEMEIGAKLIDWKAKWHPHGKGPKSGSIVTGLGMAIHTWAGGGHASSCLVKVHPDGGRRDVPRQSRSRHWHADRDRHGGGRDVRPASIGGEGEHRQFEIPGQRSLGRKHDRGRRGRVDAPHRARRAG